MKTFPRGIGYGLLAMALLAAGCGKHGHHDHEHGSGHGPHDGHKHSEGSTSGASFKAGKGVILADETRKSLGLQIADVTERKIPNQIRLTIQVFGEKHQHLLNPDDHTGCDMHGSGFLATNASRNVKPGLPVQLSKGTNHPLHGVVRAVQKALALGESEVVVGVSNATTALSPGEFVPAVIHLPRDEAVRAIPKSALLRTSEGTFAYTVNGDAYLRTSVKIGAEADGWVEVTDGLLDGDQVVTTPAETLWLIELRATKGGGHSH